MIKKKYLFVMTSMLPMPPVRGGAVQTLVETLVEDNENSQNYDITIISIPNKKAKIEAEKYKNTRFIYSKIPDIFLKLKERQIKYLTGLAYKIVHILYMMGVKKLVAKEKFDVIIFENEIHIEKIKRYKGSPLKILHLHNDYINKKTKDAIHIIESFDYIITVSQYIKRRIEEVIQSKEVFVVYNGIDVDRMKRNESERIRMREYLGIAKNDVVFCFAARLVKEKGILELVKAFNQLPEELGKSAVLMILGSKLYGVNVEDGFIYNLREESCKSRYRIIYTGYIDYKDIAKYYTAADIGCLPSICEEAFPLSVIEYKASGMPVIASDAGGVVEQMSDDFGCIVERSMKYTDSLCKAMQKYLENRNLISEQGERAEIDAQQYNKAFYCQKFFKILDKVLNMEENL